MKQLLRINKITKQFSILQGHFDDYACYHVHMAGIKNTNQFNNDLQDTLREFEEKHIKAIWVKLPNDQLSYSPILINQGFKMHHCTEHYLLFSQWLVKGEKSRLPSITTHNVGAGGLIIKDNKILLVQEKNGSKKEMWGIPNGLIDNDELIIETAVREVKEETDLDVEAQDVLLIREVPKNEKLYGDIYFVVVMKMKDANQIVKISECEILDHKWVDVNDLDQFLLDHKVSFTQAQVLNTVIQRNKGYNVNFNIGETIVFGQNTKYAVYKKEQ